MSDNKRRMTADDVYNIAYIEDPRISPDGQWIAYVHMTIDRVKNTYLRNIWVASTEGGAPIQMTRGDYDTQPRWSPDSAMLAFTSARKVTSTRYSPALQAVGVIPSARAKPQIYILPVGAPGGEARPLTSLKKGANSPAWSADGRQIAFLAPLNAEERRREAAGEEDPPASDAFESEQRKWQEEYDERMTTDPRETWRVPYREDTAFVDERYAQIYVVDVGGDETPRRLTDVDADHSLPSWTPDGAYIITHRTAEPLQDEPFMHESLYRIAVSDGTETRLTDENFVDQSPKVSPDGQWVAYLRRPAANTFSSNLRLAIIGVDGGEPRDLTLELDRSPVEFRWATDSGSIYFNAADRGDQPIFRVSLDDGGVETVVEGTMEIESFDVRTDGGIAYNACTPVRLPELFWRPAGGDSSQMTNANAWIDDVIVQETHEMWFEPPDGTPIQGWYILPVGFEEGRKYPLIHHIHGGPHVMWSSSSKTMFHEWQFHAARGYAIFYCNPRGGDGYGEAFRAGLLSAWGEADMPDQMAGLEQVLEMGFVDESRMALTGGSYGGFMTAWVVGHTDRYAAAVSQRGVYHLMSWTGTADIPSLVIHDFESEPWEDHEKWWHYSPLAYAHQIKTPFLMIHSDNDFRVPISDAEQMLMMIRRAGDTPVKLVRYPREGHELSRSGEPRHRVSRLTYQIEWCDEYCMG